MENIIFKVVVVISISNKFVFYFYTFKVLLKLL